MLLDATAERAEKHRLSRAGFSFYPKELVGRIRVAMVPGLESRDIVEPEARSRVREREWFTVGSVGYDGFKAFWAC